MSAVKFNFIIDRTDVEVNEFISADPDRRPELFLKYDMCWCLQTFLRLSKRSGIQLTCSNRLQEDCINIITSEVLRPLNRNSSYLLNQKSSHFIVCARIDHPLRIWAHYHIVQNQSQVGANSSYVPHWPQPGQINRDINRKGVKTVAYVGYSTNGNLASTPEAWKKLVEPYELEFKYQGEKAWHDLGSVDALIGIRSFDRNPHDNKPPSKLINAWHAQIPFIGGYDSAFKQVGAPGEDYLLAKTQEEALAALLQLRDDPALYSKLVNNGLCKAKEYTFEMITQKWEDILTGPVLKRYIKWQSRQRYERIRFSILLKVGGLQHNIRQIIKKLINYKP